MSFRSGFLGLVALCFSAALFAAEYTQIDNPKSEGLKKILAAAKDVSSKNKICNDDNDCLMAAYKYKAAGQVTLNVFDFMSSEWEYDPRFYDISVSTASFGAEIDGLVKHSTKAVSRSKKSRIRPVMIDVLKQHKQVADREDWQAFFLTSDEWMAHFTIGALVLVDTANSEFVVIGFAPQL